MNKKDIKDVLLRVSTGKGSIEDEQIVDYWLHDLHMNDITELSEQELQQESDLIYENIIKKTPSKVKHIRLWPRIAASVAAACLIVTGVYLFSGRQDLKGTKEPLIELAGDVAPGKVGATLTLANGKKIRLSDASIGALADEAGVSIRKNSKGEVVYEIKASGKPAEQGKSAFNTLSTARGETYMVVLPDQSKVWLNAASSLTYSLALERDGIRKVGLVGEAYFEVFGDKRHPFVVQTGQQQVTVLGTHFNINSYSDEAYTATTLLEGLVKVSPLLKGRPVGEFFLKPDQQAQLNASGKLAVKDVPAENMVAWKNGKFSFKNEDLGSIMRKVGRWYDVEVEFQDAQNIQVTFSGKVSRFDNVSKVLQVLEQTGDAKFKVEGRKITVL